MGITVACDRRQPQRRESPGVSVPPGRRRNAPGNRGWRGGPCTGRSRAVAAGHPGTRGRNRSGRLKSNCTVVQLPLAPERIRYEHVDLRTVKRTFTLRGLELAVRVRSTTASSAKTPHGPTEHLIPRVSQVATTARNASNRTRTRP